jgi:hypothetical protein
MQPEHIDEFNKQVKSDLDESLSTLTPLETENLGVIDTTPEITCVTFLGYQMKYIAIAFNASILSLYDIDTLERVRKIGRVSNITSMVAIGNKYIACQIHKLRTNFIVVYDWTTGEVVSTIEDKNRFSDGMYAVGGRYLLANTTDRDGVYWNVFTTLHLFDVVTGETVWSNSLNRKALSVGPYVDNKLLLIDGTSTLYTIDLSTTEFEQVADLTHPKAKKFTQGIHVLDRHTIISSAPSIDCFYDLNQKKFENICEQERVFPIQQNYIAMYDAEKTKVVILNREKGAQHVATELPAGVDFHEIHVNRARGALVVTANDRHRLYIYKCFNLKRKEDLMRDKLLGDVAGRCYTDIMVNAE